MAGFVPLTLGGVPITLAGVPIGFTTTDTANTPGGQADVANRLAAALPDGWFPDVSPVLAAVLNGFAYGFARIFALLGFAKAQQRVATAAGVWLDFIAADYFGTRFVRRAGEADASFAPRLSRELTRPRVTRASVVEVLTDLGCTGVAVFEPARVQDTGGYGVAMGYGAAGAWGSLALPFQAFVRAHRPSIGAGFGGGGYGAALGYGQNAGGYVSLGNEVAGVSDSNIYAAVASVLPAGTDAWVQLA